MEIKNPRFSQQTDYPKLYSQTYWGAFKLDGTHHKMENMKKIFENRNAFPKEYNIKQIAKLKLLDRYWLYMNNDPDQRKYGYDHLEMYKLDDGKILILNSPYDTSQERTKMLEGDGWKKIYELYFDSAHSFIKIMTVKEIRNALKKTGY